MSKSTEILVVATAKAKPGKEAALEWALRDVAAPTLRQRGCLQFELYRSAQDPLTLTALEHWSSEEDHQRHMHGDHVKALIAQFEGVLAEPPVIVAMKLFEATVSLQGLEG